MTHYSILYWSIVLFVGAMAGNFMTVAEYRMPLNKSILGGRSFCPKCKADLKVYEILPIVSWLCLLGKCSHCGVEVPAKYVRIEVIMAALAGISFMLFENTMIATFVFTGLALVFLQILLRKKVGFVLMYKQSWFFGMFMLFITLFLLNAAEPLRHL